VRYFDDYDETHALMYTQLHKEFSASLEAAINEWLAYKGLSEEHLEAMLAYAQQSGDKKTDEIIGVLLGMMDYEQWIANIFDLKRNSRLPLFADIEDDEPMAPQLLAVTCPDGVAAGDQLQVATPDGQTLLVSVPEGIGPGMVFNVSY